MCSKITTTLSALLVFMLSVPVFSQQFSGAITVEGFGFYHEGLFAGQKRHSASIAINAEYYQAFENGWSFTFTPFGRYDNADSKRSHFDMRESYLLYPVESWELKLGRGKAFWGATEFIHLIDIINQTDLVESIDIEEKLGQSMIQLSLLRDWGVLELFVLPEFRERTFPGRNGRLRFGLPIETKSAEFESSAGKYHVDYAVRYSHSYGNWDVGLHQFVGTGREPILIPRIHISGKNILIPYYPQINQQGIDLQGMAGLWLVKLEAMYRSGKGADYFAVTGGLEYTFTGLAGTDFDLGLIGEYVYDNRGDDATTPYNNDLIFGMRMAFNDLYDTDLIAGIVQDLDSSAKIVRIEAGRRFGSNFKGSLEAWNFLNLPDTGLLHSFRNDDFFRFNLAYHY